MKSALARTVGWFFANAGSLGLMVMSITSELLVRKAILRLSQDKRLTAMITLIETFGGGCA